MKIFILLAVTLVSTSAFAHPGGHNLSCKSAAKSGAKQPLEVTLQRSNSTGWYPASYSITVDGKKYDFTTEDEMKNLGNTFHNSPLGVIVVDADNAGEENAKVFGRFTVVAIPASVKAYDTQGKLIKWSFKSERDECNDSAGKAKFKGVFHGAIRTDAGSETIETQILDCELDYDSGMAC